MAIENMRLIFMWIPSGFQGGNPGDLYRFDLDLAEFESANPGAFSRWISVIPKIKNCTQKLQIKRHQTPSKNGGEKIHSETSSISSSEKIQPNTPSENSREKTQPKSPDQ